MARLDRMRPGHRYFRALDGLLMAQHAARVFVDPQRALTEGSLQRWAYDYVTSDVLAYKLAPPPVPDLVLSDVAPLRIARPGRPPELVPAQDKAKSPRPGALHVPKKRAQQLHTFFHHELQAAELMCWAVLAFPETPASFKRGLVNICHDEIRHMRLYAEHIERLGCKLGDFPVRDWFWARVPNAQSVSAYLAVMGLGFEAGNLDHTQRFAERFRAVGDEAGAKLQEHVAREEVAHVAFAAHWFKQLNGGLTFDAWVAALPAPLSPMVMRGEPLDRTARAQAGMDTTFLDALEQWQPVSRGS